MEPTPRFRMHRPPWWPEDQPWPPPRRRFRHNPFFRRMGCFFGVINLLGITLFILLVLFILRTFGPVDINLLIKWALPIGLGGLVLIALIAAVSVRSLRRISAPLDDLHEAAERVAKGDYSVRVVEKGAPEVRSLAR